ncbi:hypothetical protein B296_00041367 [Ensete ventricosum]|uniref:Uncharacterized protein n=1 Tax=Ensete ventricosum TaxID=4639 RepID=A0A426XV51_ENSVE|nr:hypothetical protein B296_00041367 [Ensete ventricosum]
MPQTIGTRSLAYGGCRCWHVKSLLAWPQLHVVVACSCDYCHCGCGQPLVANPRAAAAYARLTQHPACAVGNVTTTVSPLCAHAAECSVARVDLGGRKRRSNDCNRRSKGCYVSVALRKKTLATPKGHQRLRAATTTAVAVEGDMGCDHKGSSSGRIGKKLSLDSEERRDNLS